MDAEVPEVPADRVERSTPPRRPTWVKVLGIVLALAVVVTIAVMVLAGGEHGPGRHLPGGNDPAGHTPPVQHDS